MVRSAVSSTGCWSSQLVSMTVSFSAPFNAVKATNKRAVFALMEAICFDVWSRREVAVFPFR